VGWWARLVTSRFRVCTDLIEPDHSSHEPVRQSLLSSAARCKGLEVLSVDDEATKLLSTHHGRF
jgi:hypothetical protein